MQNIIMTVAKLFLNIVVLIACIGFFAFVYVLIWLSEAGSHRPKLAVH